MRIGLLGGSFNPSHEGHLQISQIAQARLGLDQVWWLVSPQNPLKSSDGMDSLQARTTSALTLDLPPFVRVTALENEIGTRYSIDTIRHLVDRHRAVRFVWLMGADNLSIFHRWRSWRDIARLLPIAVIDRPGFGLAAMASKAASFLDRYRLDEADALALAGATPPAWIMLHGPLCWLSATEIRRARASGKP